MITRLLRFPGSGFPKQALTGDPVLDQYLRDVDAHLIGGAKVRAHYLAQLTSQLTKRRPEGSQAGESELAASEAAIREAPDPQSLGATQRHTLVRRFWENAIWIFPFFYLGRLSTNLHRGEPFPDAFHSTLLGAGLLTLVINWLMTFGFPLRRVTALSQLATVNGAAIIWFALSAGMSIGAALGAPALGDWISAPRDVSQVAIAYLMGAWICAVNFRLVRRQRSAGTTGSPSTDLESVAVSENQPRR